ncbi:peptidylprolyl isomerase [Porphyromonas pogonae]|uniref:peptidylprolyl isomerase n=1 Tax=Porphyromonas pogonae TaxID=867595 RepID=UPI002E77DEC1|nr:peptidylprolyl isomerase [Porphyromonas pogonae]
MATLQKIRNNAALLITVIAIALFAFIIGDGLRSGSTWFRQSKEVVLNINGEKISIQDYQVRLKEMQDMTEGNGQKMSDEQRTMLNNQLAQQYITEYALNNITDKVGIKVTSDELYALIRGEGVSASPVAQQFFSQFGIDTHDVAAVNNFIRQMSDSQIKSMPADQQGYVRNIQAQWIIAQKAILTNRLQEKLGTLVARTYAINKVDAELESGMPSREVALVRTSASAIADNAVKVSDDDIKKYYESHKEAFVMANPATQVSYISLQVQPSAADYKVAEEAKNKAYQELSSDANVESVLRNYSEKFVSNAYITGKELDQMGLGAANIDFIKSASIGQVSTPELINDKYSLIKLVNKKTGAETINIKLIALDSINAKKADSIANALNAGGNFDDAVAKYSIDPNTKPMKGLVTFPNQFGQPDSAVTELSASQMQIDTLFHVPAGQVIKLERGNVSMLVKAVNPGAAVDKYKIAYVGIPAEFSDATYNQKYAIMNKILTEGGSFDDMAKKAQAAGLSVVRNEMVFVQNPGLGKIPDSREIVSWALKGKKGDITEKLYRCGTDHLVIASIADQLPAGYFPLSMVKDNIKTQLIAEKKGEQMVKQLEAKKLTSLEAYATDLDTKVDTLVGVNYIVRGSEAPAFNGYAMTTPLQKLSKPFVAGTEVMVVQPLSETAVADKALQQSQMMQRRADVSRQMTFRAFNSLIKNTKVEDNRARFY